MPPSASRDWPESDKSIYSLCSLSVAWRATPFVPFPLNHHISAKPTAYRHKRNNRFIIEIVSDILLDFCDTHAVARETRAMTTQPGDPMHGWDFWSCVPKVIAKRHVH